MRDTIVIDIETTKAPNHQPWMDNAYPVAVGIGYWDGSTKTWVINHQDVIVNNQQEIIEEIQKEVNKAKRIVGHNLKFDINWLKKLGINYENKKLFCTMVAEYMIDGMKKHSYSLDEVCKRRKIPQKLDIIKTFWNAGYETDTIPLHHLLNYLKQDCRITMNLFKKQIKNIKEKNLSTLIAIHMGLMRILADIEYNGMKFDIEKAKTFISKFEKKLEEIDDKLQYLFGWDVNLNSNVELSAAIFGGEIKRIGKILVTRKLKSGEKKYIRQAHIKIIIPSSGLEIPRDIRHRIVSPTGHLSVSKENIALLKATTKRQEQIKELLLERSRLNKALTTFIGKDKQKGLINKVMSDGCIHPQFNQTQTRTGRLSSSNPNSQNLPRQGTSPLKECIVPRFDYIGNGDLSQLEWRTCAFLCQDEVMIEEIKNNVDCHLENAKKYFGDAKYRTEAKVFAFRMIYGGSALGFYSDPKMPRFSLDKWRLIIEGFYDKYKGLRKWHQDLLRWATPDEVIKPLPTGRYFNIDTSKRDLSIPALHSQIKNYPVQALATADIVPMCMVEIDKEIKKRKLRSLMICQVHDSIVFDLIAEEVKEIEEICLTTFRQIPQLMKKYFNIDWNVPMDGEFEIGPNYGQLGPVDEVLSGSSTRVVS